MALGKKLRCVCTTLAHRESRARGGVRMNRSIPFPFNRGLLSWPQLSGVTTQCSHTRRTSRTSPVRPERGSSQARGRILLCLIRSMFAGCMWGCWDISASWRCSNYVKTMMGSEFSVRGKSTRKGESNSHTWIRARMTWYG